MRRTSVTSGKLMSQHALEAVNLDAESGNVKMNHVDTSGTSHTWVPIFDRVREIIGLSTYLFSFLMFILVLSFHLQCILLFVNKNISIFHFLSF